MTTAGQVLNVIACADTAPGAGAGQVAGPVSIPACPIGQDAYVIQSYVPYVGSQAFIDGLMAPFDTAIASGIFGFAFGLVVVFYLIGLKGSVLLRHFWGGRY
jgi:hypothetical protein